MSYTAEISRDKPTLIALLVDQSGSMVDAVGGATPPKSKAQGVADAVNNLLRNLVARCSKPKVYDYFDVAVIGYGRSTGPVLGGALVGREVVKISEIADNPLRIDERTRKTEDGVGGLVDETVKVPVWLDPTHDGGTPMSETLRLVHDLISSWNSAHPDSFPPIVVNITDGESTDGDPLAGAKAVMNLSTTDGNVLLFNCDISRSEGRTVLFPDSDEMLPDVSYERKLFEMSSELPEKLLREAQTQIGGVKPGARGFAFQADLAQLIQFLDIGTRVNLR